MTSSTRDVIDIVAVVLIVTLVLIGFRRRQPRLWRTQSRPRARIKRAAAADVAVVEENAQNGRPDSPGTES
jgi:hypothetical protein